MHAPGKPATRRVERNYFIMCLFSAVSMLCAISYVHVMDEAGGCGDGFQTFLAYMYIFALYEFFGWFVLHPTIITFRWVLGGALLRLSTDADTDEETMACCWKKLPCCCCCGCPPQPSARVDDWGYAKAEPALDRGESSKGGSVWSADVENGGASPTPSYRSRHTSERDLVLEWKKNKAQTSLVVAKELLRRASRAKERARIARTETAIATAAAAEAEARAAEASEVGGGQSRRGGGRALRDALPPPRPGRRWWTPTPQSMMATPPPSMALPPLDEAAFEVDEVHLDLPEVHLDLPGDLRRWTRSSRRCRRLWELRVTRGRRVEDPAREDEFRGSRYPRCRNDDANVDETRAYTSDIIHGHRLQTNGSKNFYSVVAAPSASLGGHATGPVYAARTTFSERPPRFASADSSSTSDSTACRCTVLAPLRLELAVFPHASPWLSVYAGIPVTSMPS